MNRKNILLLVIVFIAGFTVGRVANRNLPNVRSTIQRDTVTVYETVRYSRLQLKMNTYEIDWSKYDDLVPEFIFIERDAVRDTSVDGIPYVMMQRQYLMTEMNGARIMHSGIGSRIDSVELSIPIRTVSTTVSKKEKHHSLSLGIGLSMSSQLGVPLSIEYDYRISRWSSLSGKVEYDLISHRPLVEIGAKVPFEW